MLTSAKSVRTEHYSRAQTYSVLALQQCNVFIAVILLLFSHFKTSPDIISTPVKEGEHLFF